MVYEPVLSEAEDDPDVHEVDKLLGKPRTPFRAGCWNCGTVDHSYRRCLTTDRRLGYV